MDGNQAGEGLWSNDAWRPVWHAPWVRVRFAGQPLSDTDTLHRFVVEALASSTIASLDVVVAWAKASGLRRIEDELTAFKGAGGRSRLLVGIDEGGATSQGLRTAMTLFDQVSVFHDPSSRTFHPKLYCAHGEATSHVFVGSNNLTAGGVFFNYEAGVALELDLTDPGDLVFRNEVRDYIDRLYGDTDIVIELSAPVLAALESDPRYRIQDESTSRRSRGGDVEDVDTAAPDAPGEDEEETASLFGRSRLTKARDPRPQRSRGQAPRETPVRPEPPDVAHPPPEAGPVPTVVARWSKKLSASDARHPPSASSHVTGVLRLVQAGHPIDRTTYFRGSFFAMRVWTGTQRPRGLFEETTVPFRIIVNGVDYGTRDLRVDHAPWREAGQGNHTTVLHWDDVAPILDATNLTDHYVLLDRLSDGTFRLEITPDQPVTAFIG